MPTSAVRCTNNDCQHYNTVRTVELAEVGTGLYSRALLVCECGHHPLLVDRFTRYETAVRNPPERTAHRAPAAKRRPAAETR